MYFDSSFQILTNKFRMDPEIQQQLDYLMELADVAKKDARKQKLLAADAVHKSASNKRTAKKIMESLFILEDLDQLWAK